MGRLFGTDGVRGRANDDLTAELALDLAVAAAHVLAESGEFGGHRPVAVVGRDPRASGEFLEAAVVAGLASAGVDVVRVGVVPDARRRLPHRPSSGADLGVMLSASHNPMPDNGIKFFARGGVKLDDAVEDAIEARLREPWDRPTGAGVGRVRDDARRWSRTTSRTSSPASARPARLDGLTVVVDCANGAAYVAGPDAFEARAPTVVAIHAEPDGLNINDGCGSTHLDALRAAVVEHGADLGHRPRRRRRPLPRRRRRRASVVDGDQILAVLAARAAGARSPRDDTVVATVMSNLGFGSRWRRAASDVGRRPRSATATSSRR